jgi:hypothetical protein
MAAKRYMMATSYFTSHFIFGEAYFHYERTKEKRLKLNFDFVASALTISSMWPVTIPIVMNSFDTSIKQERLYALYTAFMYGVFIVWMIMT